VEAGAYGSKKAAFSEWAWLIFSGVRESFGWVVPPDGDGLLSDPVPLHRIRLSDLMSPPDAPEVWVAKGFSDEGLSRLDASLEREVVEHGLRSKAEVIHAVPGYRMASDGKTVAVFDSVDETVVGGFLNREVFVLPRHRGRGLGAEILIVAFESGAIGPDNMSGFQWLSPGGRANRRAAHRLAVERALDAGLAVSDDVLVDYPDLAVSAMAL
jgi:GNAT superfamily N-acetyltransferase